MFDITTSSSTSASTSTSTFSLSLSLSRERERGGEVVWNTVDGDALGVGGHETGKVLLVRYAEDH